MTPSWTDTFDRLLAPFSLRAVDTWNLTEFLLFFLVILVGLYALPALVLAVRGLTAEDVPEVDAARKQAVAYGATVVGLWSAGALFAFAMVRALQAKRSTK